MKRFWFGCIALGMVMATARADTIAILTLADGFVDQIRADCRLPDGPFTANVVPLSATASPLAPDDDQELTRTIEEALRNAGVRVGVSFDTDKLTRRLPAGLQGSKQAADIVKEVAAAEVTIWPEVTLRDDRKATLRLVALRAAPACKSITQTVVTLTQAARPKNVRRFMRSMARRILKDSELANGGMIHLSAMRNRNNRYSECDEVLGGILHNAFNTQAERISASAQSAIATTPKVTSSTGTPVPDDPSIIVVEGKWGIPSSPTYGNQTRRRGEVWVSLTVRRGGKVFYTRGRQRLVGLECDVKTYTFTDKIEADAALDPGILLVHARRPVFRANRDQLDVEISSRLGRNQEMELYCWYISDEALAYIVIPNPGLADTLTLTGNAPPKRFPRDFGLPEQDLTQPSRDLFHCFASRDPLPVELKRAWMARFGASGNGPNGELEEKEIFDLLARMRRQPGIVEGLTRIVVQ